MSGPNDTSGGAPAPAVVNGRAVPLLTRAELARSFPDPRTIFGADHTREVILRYQADRGVLRVYCAGCGGIVGDVLVAQPFEAAS